MADLSKSTDDVVKFNTPSPQIVPDTGYVDNKTDTAITNDDRTNQQGLLNTAITARFLNPVNHFPNVLKSSLVVPPGFSSIFYFNTTNGSGQLIVHIVAFQVYIDGVVMPQGVSSANFPFYVWNNLYNSLDGGSAAIETNEIFTAIQIRNNDSVQHTISVEGYTRYIANQANAAPRH